MTTQDKDLFSQFEELLGQLSILKAHVANVQQQVKQIEKGVKKQLKQTKRETKKQVVQDKDKDKTNRTPSGFARPSEVTSELCSFLNIKEGTTIARTDVTRAIIAYIKKHKLENPTNARMITPDEKLKTLLGVEEGQELTYFTLQKYMTKHFVSKNKKI
jgi:chromatin remodeling complex protein RSC6